MLLHLPFISNIFSLKLAIRPTWAKEISKLNAVKFVAVLSVTAVLIRAKCVLPAEKRKRNEMADGFNPISHFL
jgi:hypothetical protein